MRKTNQKVVTLNEISSPVLVVVSKEDK